MNNTKKIACQEKIKSFIYKIQIVMFIIINQFLIFISFIIKFIENNRISSVE